MATAATLRLTNGTRYARWDRWGLIPVLPSGLIDAGFLQEVPPGHASAAGLIRLQAVRNRYVLADQRYSGRLGLHQQQRCKVLGTVTAADQALHELVHQGGDRQRDVARAGRGQAEVEVLAQQAGGEGRVKVQ